MVYFSSSSLTKSKGFPFLVCERQEENLGKGCGQTSACAPHIPLPRLRGADRGQWSFPLSPAGKRLGKEVQAAAQCLALGPWCVP